MVGRRSRTYRWRVGQAAFSFAGREISRRLVARSIRCWRWSKFAERKLAGIKVGDTADVRLVTRRASPSGKKIDFGRQDRRARPPATYRVEIELPNCRTAKNPRRDYGRGRHARLSPTPATRISALPRSTFSLKPAILGVARRRGRTRPSSFVPGQTWSRNEQGFMWVTRHPPKAGRVIVQGAGFRARRPKGRCGDDGRR